jgi:hypothetical protein
LTLSSDNQQKGILVVAIKNVIMLNVATECQLFNAVLKIIVKNVIMLRVMAHSSVFVIYHTRTKQKP